MKRGIKRVLGIVCSMTVMLSSLTVIPVRAEEMQTESIELSTEMVEEAETEEIEETQTEQLMLEDVTDNEEILQEPEIVAEDTSEATKEQEEQVSIISTDQTYTDENGNVFIYVLDELGNATITSITLSGAALTIPSTIHDAPVVSVANGNICVVSNPEVKIPELFINCHTIGIRAFYGVDIGTLISSH